MTVPNAALNRRVSTHRAGNLRRDRVTSELARRILSGAYPPGFVLPTEAALSVELGVSRTALREAMRMLAAKGLVATRQRAGTSVCQPASWNRLDADVLHWMSEIEPDPVFVRGLTEAREVIEPAAAAMACRRASARDLAVIEAAYEAMCAAPSDDVASFAAADVRFHLAILNASENPVFANLGNMIAQALLNAFKFTTTAMQDYRLTLDAHGEVLEAIRLRQPEVAEARMRALISIASQDLALAVQQMKVPRPVQRETKD